MSIEAMLAIWDLDLDHNEQAVALALANHANELGERMYPSLNRVAWRTGYSHDSVKRIVRRLREKGVLILVSTGHRGHAAEYRFDYSAVPRKAPYRKGGEYDTPIGGKGGESVPGKGGDIAPPNPHGETTTTPPKAPPDLPLVGKKRVTGVEHELAAAILDVFNHRAGTSYRLATHLPLIVRRIRERPEITQPEHLAIIANEFARPWWKDKPGPQVIYGNARVFEHAIERWRSAGSMVGTNGSRATQPEYGTVDGDAMFARGRKAYGIDNDEGTTT